MKEKLALWTASFLILFHGLIGISSVAFIGLARKRKWGLAPGVVVCVVTYCILTLYLPFGAADAVLSTQPLLIIIVICFGKGKIEEEQSLS